MEEKHEELLQAQVSQQEETKLMIEEDKIVMVKKGILLIVDVFSPLLPFIIVYGILMTCLQICSVLNLHHTLTQFLTLMNHCILSLIPFALLQTIAKKFQTSEILAIAVGLSMTISAYYPGLSQINHYNGQIIPAVFVGLFLVFLEKTLKKYIQSTFVPMLCWAIAIIVVQMLLGPISSDINKGLAMMLSWCFTSEARFIVAPCLCYLSYYF